MSKAHGKKLNLYDWIRVPFQFFVEFRPSHAISHASQYSCRLILGRFK